MKRIITCLLAISLLSTAFAREEISDVTKNTEDLWRTGAGASDGAFTAISTSMIAWGVGLGVGIALLAAALNHSSSSKGSNAHCHTTH